MKPWYKSRTIWVSGLLAAANFIDSFGNYLPKRVVVLAAAVSGAVILFFRISDIKLYKRIALPAKTAEAKKGPTEEKKDA